MYRAARIDAPGVLQHVIGRGIEKRSIFRDDADCEDFITRLANHAISGVSTSCITRPVASAYPPDVGDLLARIYGDSVPHLL
jgi:hypothetical protein